jgi:hypothetical protein
MAGQGAIALGALLLVWAWPRWSPTAARRLLVVVMALDLGLFALTCSTGMYSGGTPQPTRAQSAAAVGTSGRFAIVGAPSINALSKISVTDINGLTGLDSVQGYGSILSDDYQNATDAHQVGKMDPCALAQGVFVPLRLSTLLVIPQELTQQLAPGAQPTPPAACRAPRPGTGTSRTWYLGQDLLLASVGLAGGTGASTPPMVGVLHASGSTSWPAERVSRQRTGWAVRFAGPQSAVGIVVRGPVRSIADTSTVTTTTGTRLALDGPFQDPLGQTSWRPAGFWDGYARFRTDDLAPVIAVRGAPGATVRQVSVTPWGTETDVVDTSVAATVVRSEAYLSGWKVLAQPVGGGPTRTLAVFAVGLVQGVRVPPGRWTLTFAYRPSGLTSGGILSGLGVAGLVVVTGVRLRRRLARKRPAEGTAR